MLKFYANENFSKSVVVALRKLGHDVLTTVETNQAGFAIPDDEVLKFSTQQQRILLTFNRRDFIRLHQIFPKHAGIIVCIIDPDATALAERIHHKAIEVDSMTGVLLRVVRPQTPEG